MNRWVSLAGCQRIATVGGPSRQARPQSPGDPDPEVPVDRVAIRRVEAADRRVGRLAGRHGRASERVLASERSGPAPGAKTTRPIGRRPDRSRSQPGSTTDAGEIGLPASSIISTAAGDQAELAASAGLDHPPMRRQVAGTHHVVLVEDRHPLGPAQLDAPIPVARQAEPLGVDRDPGPVAALVADDRQGLVVRAVVGDDQVERDARLGPDRRPGPRGGGGRRCRWAGRRSIGAIRARGWVISGRIGGQVRSRMVGGPGPCRSLASSHRWGLMVGIVAVALLIPPVRLAFLESTRARSYQQQAGDHADQCPILSGLTRRS